MFRNFFRRTPPPATSATNPGKAVELRVHGTRDTGAAVNVVVILADVLRSRGHSVRQHASWLTVEHGFTLLPRIAEINRTESGAHWRIATTIEVHHAELFPTGVFEFQHSVSDDVADALHSGFSQFENIDYSVLRAAASGQSGECTFIDFKERYYTTRLAKGRRVVLGPVSWTVQDSAAAQKDDHPFCPCCFFTNSREAMDEKVLSSDVCAIRLGEHVLAADGIRISRTVGLQENSATRFEVAPVAFFSEAVFHVLEKLRK